MKLQVSHSPHVRDKATTQSIMLDVIIALLPATLAGWYYFGIRAVLITMISVASCIIFEYILAFDGSVYKKRDSIATSIVSANENFLREIKIYLISKINIKGGSISKNHNIYQLNFGKYDSLKLCSAFYDNDYLALPRKKNKYIALR